MRKETYKKTEKVYKPSDRFDANMKMVEAILEDVKKEMQEENLDLGFVLSVVIRIKNTKKEFVHIHGHGLIGTAVDAVIEGKHNQGPDNVYKKNIMGKY